MISLFGGRKPCQRYNDGTHVQQDYAEARKWNTLASEQGNPQAQFNLGTSLISGRPGVPADRAEAGKWLKCAAEQGYCAAQFNMGMLLGLTLEGIRGFNLQPSKWGGVGVYTDAEEEQGLQSTAANANKCLDQFQAINAIRPPAAGSAVIVVLLSTAAGMKFNNLRGKVVAPLAGAGVKPGRAAVVFDGDADSVQKSFKCKNLRIVV